MPNSWQSEDNRRRKYLSAAISPTNLFNVTFKDFQGGGSPNTTLLSQHCLWSCSHLTTLREKNGFGLESMPQTS